MTSVVCEGTIGDRPDDASLGPPFKPTGTCFRCGQDGHWARQCKGVPGNTYLYGCMEHVSAVARTATGLVSVKVCQVIHTYMTVWNMFPLWPGRSLGSSV